MQFSSSLLAQAGLAILSFTHVQALPAADFQARPTPTPVKHIRALAPAITLAPRQDSPLCTPFQDPDHGDSGGCSCSGVSSIIPFQCTTGDGCNVCGYTAIPTSLPSSSAAGPFTTTNTDGFVISCETSSTENAAVNTAPTCAGASKTISNTNSGAWVSFTAGQAAMTSEAAALSAAQPTTTVQVGSKQISVGSMRDANLTDAITNSLNTICGGTDSGACSGNNAFGALYIDANNMWTNGDLTVTVQEAHYNSTDQRDAMIAMIAASYGKTTTAPDQCEMVMYKKQCPNSAYDQCPAGQDVQCKMANFVASQILHVNPDTHGAEEQATMAVEISYASMNPMTLGCSSLLGLLGLGIGMIPGGGLVTGTTANILGATSFVCQGEGNPTS